MKTLPAMPEAEMRTLMFDIGNGNHTVLKHFFSLTKYQG